MPHRPTVLFVVDGDPRVSHRPAEAIRIAAGVAAWKKVDVEIYLHGAAVLTLAEWTDELVDGDSLEQCLPLLDAHDARILAQADSPEWSDMDAGSIPFHRTDRGELAERSAAASQLLRF